MILGMYIIIFFLIFFLICLLLWIFCNKFDYKVLTGIVCIDRDYDLSQELYDALIENNVNDIMVVTRETDTNINIIAITN